MLINELYKQVCGCDQFKKAKFDYLVHFYVMLDDKFKPMTCWQIGFYNKESDHVVCFDIAKEITTYESKAFKHATHIVQELDINKVKMDFEEAIESVKKFISEKLPGHPAAKVIMLLQTIHDAPTWNITVITGTFNILNIKLNAETKEIVSDELSSLLSLKGN